MSNKIEVNFGGRIEPGTQYVYTLTNIVASPEVVQYPEEFKGKMLYAPGREANKYHTVLTPEESKIVENTPIEERTSNAGKAYKALKIADELLFVFTNDITGSETGKYDFAFNLYPGFRPDNNFKAFLLATKGLDANDLTGKKNLAEIYNVGTDKFILETAPELRNGKWAQIDKAKIQPYVPGMKLTTASGTTEVEDKLLEVARTTKITPLDMSNRSDIGTSEEIRKAFNHLKDKGKITVQGGVIVVT